MTRIISHRGYLDGPDRSIENNPSQIDLCIEYGFDVEIDVWAIQGALFLGHDEAKEVIDISWLNKRVNKLWVHCKNIEALAFFSDIEENFNFFFHQEDDYTLTSQKFIWAYPEKIITKNSIALIFKFNRTLIKEAAKDAYGICTDYPRKIKSFLK